MSDDKDWSLKGRWGLTDYGNKIYTEDDIETLRQKLIDDIKKCNQISHPYGSDDVIEKINNRFGKE